jgi:hypothetical protein
VINLTIGGRNVSADDFGKELMVAAVAQVASEMRERISAIRHPDTGEFPTVVVRGESIDDLSLLVEGSPELLALVRERLSPQLLQHVQLGQTDPTSAPRVFLSYGFEDRTVAEMIAKALQKQGIDTWWAEWEMQAGDSLRQKIDDGLANCTHFVVLLTPTSLTKPWVNLEIDAGLVGKIQQRCRFIPLRYGLKPDALPPLLSGMVSPEVDAIASNLRQLVNDIHGVTRKPPLGPAPAAVHVPRTGYSAAATAIARVFITTTQHGGFGDPQTTTSELAKGTGLSDDDLSDALHEIRHLVKTSFDTVLVRPELFATFDKFWMQWDPAQDALRLAADLVNDAAFPTEPRAIAERYSWAPRRLNPALAYLRERNAVRLLEALGSGPFIAVDLHRTDDTRRFARSRAD